MSNSIDGKLFERFSFKVIQSVMQVKRVLDKNDISWGDFENWIDERAVEIAKVNNSMPKNVIGKRSGKVFTRKMVKRCPECGKILNGSDLHKDSEKYETGYRSYWICGATCCAGKGCGYEEFSRLTVEENMKNIRPTKE